MWRAKKLNKWLHRSIVQELFTDGPAWSLSRVVLLQSTTAAETRRQAAAMKEAVHCGAKNKIEG
jgi:hypothetical protein